MPIGYTMKFIDMVWAAFLARVKPVSTSANPACMNMTRKPVIRVQTMLMEILLWPTVSITSARAGFAASFTGTSAAVPVVAPVGSGPRGVGAGAGAGSTAGAAAPRPRAGAGDGSWARLVVVRRHEDHEPEPDPERRDSLAFSSCRHSFAPPGSRLTC